MNQPELLPHLFRTEFRKMAAVLVKSLGIGHITTAEDIASETFELALKSWPYKGIPENPVAWLYTVAKNKAKNHIQRDLLFAGKIANEMKSTFSSAEEMDIDLSEQNITDSQLQMLFALCHPVIPAEAQVALSLRILCGFGIDEIANAFLTTREVINKRLFRAKEKLRQQKIAIVFPDQRELALRLDTVLTTLYLLFSEGYYSESDDNVLREEFCREAMRLMELLIRNPSTDQPKVNALYALMCFHASRFAARRNKNNELILYHHQDETLWDEALIRQGAYHLHLASRGEQLSRYHLEASIAYWHTIKADSREKWESVLQLYNHLLTMSYSPIAALNRTYALSKVAGHAVAIGEALKLNLDTNPFYFALLGELHTGHDPVQAKQYFQQALHLAATKADQLTIKKKMESL